VTQVSEVQVFIVIIRYKRLLRLYLRVVFSSDTTGFSHPHISLVLDNILYQHIQR